MNRKLFVCGLLVVLAACGEAHAAGHGWRGLAEKIRPGMTRAAVEKILLKPGPDAEGSAPLYQTRHLEVESYSLDDERDLAVPYSRLTAPAGEATQAQRAAQKVIATPWVMRDLISDAGDVDEPCFKIPLPGKAGRVVKRATEQAEIMTGDLFRTGHEVAVVAYFNADGDEKEDAMRELDAVAFYSKGTDRWRLRSFFPADEPLQAFLQTGSFLELAELSGDDVPEVVLTKEKARNSSFAIFKYDRKSDRLVLAIAEIMNPERQGNSVDSFEHNGAGVFADSRYTWVGNKLILQSIGDQDTGSPEGGITVPSVPDGAEDWHLIMDQAERDAGTGAVRRWRAFGNIPWLFGGAEASSNTLLWTIVDVGQVRRTILIKPDAKATAEKGVNRGDVDVGEAIFARPERFTGNSKMKLSDGRTMPVKDWAYVEIRDDWPLVLNTGNWGEGREQIPANTVFVSTRSRSLDDEAPDAAQWRRAKRLRTRGEIPRFARKTPIALYISGPERGSATAANILVKDVKLEKGSILHVACDVTGDPPGADGEQNRLATTINLGRLEPGQYTAQVELGMPGKLPSKTMLLETRFQIAK